MTAGKAVLPTMLLLSGALLTTACEVRSRRSDWDDRRDANLDVRTPLGDLRVTKDVDADRVGLPVYAGAQPLRERGNSNADVQIDTPLFGLDVAASTFESEADPASVLAFYRTEMERLGPVTECRGDADFRGRRGEEIRCRERQRRQSETQLVVGSRNHHRIVSVKPRRGGSEFALIHIDTRGVRDFD